MKSRISNWLQGNEFGKQGTLDLAHRALDLQAGSAAQQFPGARIAAIFLNPSMRTKTSMEFAAQALGATMVSLEPGRSSWAWETEPGAIMNQDKAEHLIDAIKVLANMSNIIAVRAFANLIDRQQDAADPVLSTIVANSIRPVINLESALWHPMQGLADTTTWIDHLGADLSGTPLTLTWTPHPKALPTAVANQVLMSAALQGMNITLAHPEPFDLPPFVMEQATKMARSNGGTLQVCHDQDKALQGARVVVAKSWSGWKGYDDRLAESIQRKENQSWMVTQQKMARTNSAGFMHCLPVRRNVVVTDEVLDSDRSWTAQTGGLRMWTAMALLEQFLGEI